MNRVPEDRKDSGFPFTPQNEHTRSVFAPLLSGSDFSRLKQMNLYER